MPNCAGACMPFREATFSICANLTWTSSVRHAVIGDKVPLSSPVNHGGTGPVESIRKFEAIALALA